MVFFLFSMAPAAANAESANRGIGETYKPGKAGIVGNSRNHLSALCAATVEATSTYCGR
jgi:hypothetical protein